MKHKERILTFLTDTQKNYCDDCLSDIFKINTRQQVNQICRKDAQRTNGICHHCGKTKLVNSFS